jgi:hypothetical protein
MIGYAPLDFDEPPPPPVPQARVPRPTTLPHPTLSLEECNYILFAFIAGVVLLSFVKK